MIRRLFCGLALSVALLMICFSGGSAQGSYRGMILTLTAQGAQQPGDLIRIASRVLAIRRIPRSNLYYEVRAPSGAVVATRTVYPGPMYPRQIFGDSWSTPNTPEIGTYVVSLCWSTGDSRRCDIDYAETAFYSVPTLGPVLGLLSLALLASWLVGQRRRFAGRSA